MAVYNTSVWNPLAVNQMMSGGEGQEIPYFYNTVPDGSKPERNAQGEWGYYTTPTYNYSSWLSGGAWDANTPWRGDDFTAKDPNSIPTVLNSSAEAYNLFGPKFNALSPEVQQGIMSNPRLAIGSTRGFASEWKPDLSGVSSLGDLWNASRQTAPFGSIFDKDSNDLLPSFGEIYGYDSPGSLQWDPKYGLVAKPGSYIEKPDRGFFTEMLSGPGAIPFGMIAGFAAPALLGAAGAAGAGSATAAASGGAMSAEAGGLASIWGPEVAAWSGVPVEGSGLSALATGADSLASMTGEGNLSGGSNMVDAWEFGPDMGDMGMFDDWGAGANLSSASWGDTASPWYKQLYDAYKSPLGQTLGKLGSAGYQQYVAGNNQEDLNSLINQYRNQSDPFGAQRPGYQQLLEQSYRNPEQLYQSPEYQALGKLYTEQISRRDASKGRTVSGNLPRTIELQDHFMKWLSDYRQGLQNPAGTTINPNGLLGSLAGLYNQGQNQYYNAQGALPNAVSSLFDSYANEKEGWLEKLGSMFSSNSNSSIEPY